MYVMAMSGGAILTSPDGDTWTAASVAGTQHRNGVVWSEERGEFVVVSNGTEVRVSPDGVTWTNRVADALTSYNDVAWSPELELYVAARGDSSVSTSPDAITWTARSVTGSQARYCVVWSPELELFVLGGGSGTIRTSPDGASWTARSVTGTVNRLGAAWSPQLGLFAVVGGSGNIVTSPDGVTWTARTSPVSVNLNDVCWAPGLGMFVAVGGGGGTPVVVTSDDGVTWTSQTVPAGPSTLYSVAWSPSQAKFVVGALGGHCLTSHDGIDWDLGSVPNANVANAVTWGALNTPPHAPIVTNPAPGQTFPRNEPNTVAADFSDPDPGDSPSRMLGQVRLADTVDPYYSWDVESPNTTHVIAANELTLGGNELRVMYHDAAGEPGEWSDWVPFNVADRSGPPTIVTPTPGSTIGSQQEPIGWSAAAQEAYRLRKRVDDAGVPGDIIEGSDTGIVPSSGARSRTVVFPTNNVHEWVEVARLVDGLWSEYAQARYQIAYTPPATPTVTVTPGQGLLTVQATHPTPVDDEPAVTQMHVWRRTADESPSEDPQTPKGTGRRLQAGYGLAPSATFVDRSVASGIVYEYRVEAVGSNEVVSYSAWTG